MGKPVAPFLLNIRTLEKELVLLDPLRIWGAIALRNPHLRA
jgi:hypothetical protein